MDTSGFPADSRTGSFATNVVAAQPVEIDKYFATSELVASRVDVAGLATCDKADRSCATKFLETVGRQIYRRKLAPDEASSLLKLFDAGATDGFKVGAELMVQAMLQSPHFLYIVEFGKPSAGDLIPLTSDEVAVRLALLLWNSSPDAALLDAAAVDGLGTSSAIKMQAERMMKDSRFSQTVANFHQQLLHVNRLTQEGAITKQSAGSLSTELRKAMVDESTSFVVDAVKNGQATLATFFTAQHSFPSAALVALNQTSSAALMPGGRVEYKDGRRAGLLTMNGAMTAEPPLPTIYGAVQRGKLVRENLLCGTIPPPPPGLKFIAPAPGTPQRLVLEQHQTDPSCSGCHSLMDSIGLAFENFDELGRFRTKYASGETIDSSGKVTDADIEDTFAGPRELGLLLAKSDEVRSCMATQWFRFAIGREPTEDDECAYEEFKNTFAKGDGDIPTALLTFVQSEAFRFIKGVQQ